MNTVPKLWTSRRALLLHVTLVLVVSGCLYAAWWQANRAFSGNTLSYVYSVEWPIFAAYGVFMWWKILHEPPSRSAACPVQAPGSSTTAEARAAVVEIVPGTEGKPLTGDNPGDDEELAAYNRYLAELAQKGRRKSWRRGSLPTDASGRAVRA